VSVAPTLRVVQVLPPSVLACTRVARGRDTATRTGARTAGVVPAEDGVGRRWTRAVGARLRGGGPLQA
jgi:hypothetical protein